MNTSESLVRFVTAACLSVLLSILACLPVLAQDIAEHEAPPDSPLRVTVETGLSVSAWRVAYSSQFHGFPTYPDLVVSCPASADSTSRLGVAYRASPRAELGGFVSYDLSRPSGCTVFDEVDHELHVVTVGPSVVLRPLAVPRLFFRLGVGATWQRGQPLLANRTMRGVGASADVGYEFLHGRRATLFVTAGFNSNFSFDSITYNRGTNEQVEYGTAARMLAGTLRVGASLH